MITQPSEDELRDEIKDTALRPLADKFQELTRQIDSGDHELPKTLEEATSITEDYIDQASERIWKLIAAYTAQAVAVKSNSIKEQVRQLPTLGGLTKELIDRDEVLAIIDGFRLHSGDEKCEHVSN